MSIVRTDAEIISQTNKIALMILKQSGYEPEDPSAKCYDSKNPRAIAAWETACLIQEELTQTDPNNCEFQEEETENKKLYVVEVTANIQVSKLFAIEAESGSDALNIAKNEATENPPIFLEEGFDVSDLNDVKASLSTARFTSFSEAAEYYTDLHEVNNG